MGTSLHVIKVEVSYSSARLQPEKEYSWFEALGTCKIDRTFCFSKVVSSAFWFSIGSPSLRQHATVACAIYFVITQHFRTKNILSLVPLPFSTFAFSDLFSIVDGDTFVGGEREKSVARLNLHIDFCRRLRFSWRRATSRPSSHQRRRRRRSRVQWIEIVRFIERTVRGPFASPRPPQTTTTDERFTPRNLRARLL